jgi:hypothetical protein
MTRQRKRALCGEQVHFSLALFARTYQRGLSAMVQYFFSQQINKRYFLV